MRARATVAFVCFLILMVPFAGVVRPAYAACVPLHWGDCIYTWGYRTSNLGWLVPSNTTLFTPLVTNATIEGWVEGIVTIFPFQYDSSTTTIIGLYVNGKLVDNVTNGLGGVGGVGGGSQLLKSVASDTAVFSDYTMEFALYHSVYSSVPSGSTVTLAFEANRPFVGLN